MTWGKLITGATAVAPVKYYASSTILLSIRRHRQARRLPELLPVCWFQKLPQRVGIANLNIIGAEAFFIQSCPAIVIISSRSRSPTCNLSQSNLKLCTDRAQFCVVPPSETVTGTQRQTVFGAHNWHTDISISKPISATILRISASC